MNTELFFFSSLISSYYCLTKTFIKSVYTEVVCFSQNTIGYNFLRNFFHILDKNDKGRSAFQKVERLCQVFIIVGSTSTTTKTHIFPSMLVLAFDSYILIHFLSLMFSVIFVDLLSSIMLQSLKKSLNRILRYKLAKCWVTMWPNSLFGSKEVF